jgi:hypothetical protein
MGAEAPLTLGQLLPTSQDTVELCPCAAEVSLPGVTAFTIRKLSKKRNEKKFRSQGNQKECVRATQFILF